MAFAPDPIDPSKQPQPGAQNPLAMQAPITTSSAPGAGPAAPGTSGTGAPSSSAPTQPFVNLQEYLTANAPQIQQEGQTLANQLTGGATKATADINAAKTAFDSSVAGGYAAPNPELVSEVTANPTAAASDPTKVKAFQDQLKGDYTGPSNFETAPGTVALNKEIEQAGAAANLVNSPQGLESYFQQIEPNPTPGLTTLDSVLLGGDPTAMGMVSNAAKPYKDVTQYLTDTTNAENKSVQAAQAAAQQGKVAAQAALTGAQNAKTGQLNSELKGLQDQISAYDNNVLSGGGNATTKLNDLTSKFMALLKSQPFATWTPGRTPAEGVTPSDTFFSNPANPGLPSTAINAMSPIPAATYANAMTPQDVAEIAALQKLAGNTDWNPAPGVTAPSPVTIPSGDPYAPQTQAYAKSLQDYLSNVAFGVPVNNPLGQGGYGWLPATTGKVGQMNSDTGLSDAQLQDLLNSIAAIGNA